VVRGGVATFADLGACNSNSSAEDPSHCNLGLIKDGYKHINHIHLQYEKK